MNPRDAARGVQALVDLAEVAKALSDTKSLKPLLAEAKKLVEREEEAALLVGAPATIKRDLSAAERQRVDAEKALEMAQIEASSLLAAANKEIGDREAALDERVKGIAEGQAANNAVLEGRREAWETKQAKQQQDLSRRETALVEKEADYATRLEDLEGREKRIDGREKRAEAKKVKADQIIAGAKSLMGQGEAA